MFNRSKRKTDKITIIEDRNKNSIILRKNAGLFKNFINALRRKKFNSGLVGSLVIFSMVSPLAIFMSSHFDQSSQAAYSQAVERINEIYSGAAAAALIDQLHSPFVSTPWVTGAVIGLVAITAIMLLINTLAFTGNNQEKEYILDYKHKIDELTSEVPAELFEEYFDVMLGIQDTTGDITKIEKTLKKPMMPFLRDEISEKLEQLRKQSSELNDKKTEVHQQISQAIEEQREIKKIEKKIKLEVKKLKEQEVNNAEVLEILGELSAEDAIDYVEKMKDNEQRNSSQSTLN